MPVAFITGAGRGIGRAVAEGLAQDGYSVALAARSKEELQKIERVIKDSVPSAAVVCLPLDVSEPTAVQGAVDSVISTWGNIDLLFNNAGQHIPGTWDVEPLEFERILRVNLLGAFHCAKAVIPHMKERRAGYIMNVSSISGVHGFAGKGVYCASKFGLVGFSESLFQELVPLGIRVTALCPSWVDTDMARHGPLSAKEMISPRDITKTVRYLLTLSPNACVKELVLQCAADIL